MSWSCDNCQKKMGECQCTQADYALSNIPEKLDRIITLLEAIDGSLTDMERRGRE